MKRGAIIAAVATAGAVAVGVLRSNSGTRPPFMCAKAPTDGGTCVAKLADGGMMAIGANSVTREAFGQCEFFICPPEP